MDASEKGEISCSFRESNHHSSIMQPAAQPLSRLQYAAIIPVAHTIHIHVRLYTKKAYTDKQCTSSFQHHDLFEGILVIFKIGCIMYCFWQLCFHTLYLRFSWKDVRNKNTEFSPIELSSKSSTNYYTSLTDNLLVKWWSLKLTRPTASANHRLFQGCDARHKHVHHHSLCRYLGLHIWLQQSDNKRKT